MPESHPDIVTIERRENEKFLREKTKLVSFGPKGMMIAPDGKTFSARDVGALVMRMRKIMKQAVGIGLAANQIGLPYRIFVAEVPSADGNSDKFYAVFNPEIEKQGAEKETAEEGCLSVPGKYGEVSRAERVTIRGLDKRGKPLKIKAWGLLARVFQHETDHLNGTLYIDKAKNVSERPRDERLATRDKRQGRSS